MAFTVTDAQKAALLGNHEMSVRCTVLRGSQSLGQIPIIGGGITGNLGTRGGRDGYIIVDRNIIDDGLLNPLSDQVIISTGLEGVVDVPLFTGRTDTQNAVSEGTCEVPLLSRAAEAIRASFESPWAAVDGNHAFAEITRILRDVDSTWAVDVSRANSATIANGLVWESDRGQAVDQIAQGASLIWQPDRTGGFVVYDNPYSVGPILGMNPVVILRDGEDGTAVTVADATSRNGIYNSVTVVTERVDNTEPIRVTVRDADPTSPTMWGGIFGKQNLVVKNQTPLNLSETTILARRILSQTLALKRSWRITTPHMPLLDPGDVFSLWYRDEVTAQVVMTIDYPLSAQGSTVIGSRELALTSLVEEIL